MTSQRCCWRRRRNAGVVLTQRGCRCERRIGPPVMEEPTGEFIRRRQVSGTAMGTMRTVLDYADAGVQVNGRADGCWGRRLWPHAPAVRARCALRLRGGHLPMHGDEYGFQYDRIDFEAACTIDIRGPKPGRLHVCPHFQTGEPAATVSARDSGGPRRTGRGGGGTLPGDEPDEGCRGASRHPLWACRPDGSAGEVEAQVAHHDHRGIAYRGNPGDRAARGASVLPVW